VNLLEIAEVIKEIEDRKKTGKLSMKRVTCIHCGKTWIEFVGVVVAQKEGFEDVYLHIGTESENCFSCRWRALKCENCNAKDVYEVTFPKKIHEETPLCFKNIRKVVTH
jgi:L-cystine uptake protein TcyP (sodium:dicarboxylate symporter family)